MKRIFDFIVSIPQDKLLHIWAGMVIALVTMRILSITPVSGWFARLVTLIAVIIAGGCREWYNNATAVNLISKIGTPQTAAGLSL